MNLYPEHVAATAVAVASTLTPDVYPCRLAVFEVSIAATPTTAEDLVLSVARSGGATTELLRVDPSEGGQTNYSLRFEPDFPVYLANGDTLTVAYTNTDTKTVAATALFVEV